MKAIVMAGGEGTRLRPLTCAVPKPMVPLLDKPMLEYAVEHLLRFGVTDMAFTLGYKPAVITDWFADHTPSGARVEFFIEDTPLGTAGSVKNASAFVDGTCLVFSGDALTDIDISAAAKYHKRNRASATIVLKRMGNPLEYVVVISGEDGGVERFDAAGPADLRLRRRRVLVRRGQYRGVYQSPRGYAEGFGQREDYRQKRRRHLGRRRRRHQ